MIRKVIKTPIAKKVASPELKKVFGVPNDYNDLTDQDCSITLIKKTSRFAFYFNTVGDAFCCGMYSMGSFNIHTDSKTITEDEKVNAIKELFQKVINIVKSRNQEITLIFTLIDNISCNLVKKALADGKLFTCVKSFENLNSGKINDLYVSN